VELVQVDPVEIAGDAGCLQLLEQPFRAPFRMPSVQPGSIEPTLGRHHEVAGIGIQRLRDQLFADVRPYDSAVSMS